jgi:hypothetical protein
MTTERSAFVLIPDILATPLLQLERRAIAALRRAEKLPPGDRTEAMRFESIHAVIDQVATAAMANGEPTVLSSSAAYNDLRGTSVLHGELLDRRTMPEKVADWMAAGKVVVELRIPHNPGATEVGGDPGHGPPPPAKRWISSGGDSVAAARERFEFLLSEALSNPQGDEGTIRPSDVSNKVLTECLRRNVEAHDGEQRVDLRVTYRDGSEGPRFPLRALQMNNVKPIGWRVLRFTLMSVRHVDMDLTVDGAWLRNSRVSRPRPAGLTDGIVFDTSLRQLQCLDASVPTLICMYQTGLEPAVVGFYRAVVRHLLAHPRAVAVVPYYYQGEKDFAEGTIWRTT